MQGKGLKKSLPCAARVKQPQPASNTTQGKKKNYKKNKETPKAAQPPLNRCSLRARRGAKMPREQQRGIAHTTNTRLQGASSCAVSHHVSPCACSMSWCSIPPGAVHVDLARGGLPVQPQHTPRAHHRPPRASPVRSGATACRRVLPMDTRGASFLHSSFLSPE